MGVVRKKRREKTKTSVFLFFRLCVSDVSFPLALSDFLISKQCCSHLVTHTQTPFSRLRRATHYSSHTAHQQPGVPAFDFLGVQAKSVAPGRAFPWTVTRCTRYLGPLGSKGKGMNQHRLLPCAVCLVRLCASAPSRARKEREKRPEERAFWLVWGPG